MIDRCVKCKEEFETIPCKIKHYIHICNNCDIEHI